MHVCKFIHTVFVSVRSANRITAADQLRFRGEGLTCDASLLMMPGKHSSTNQWLVPSPFNHYHYHTNLWTQYEVKEMQLHNITKCQTTSPYQQIIKLSNWFELNFIISVLFLIRFRKQILLLTKITEKYVLSFLASLDNSSISSHTKTYRMSQTCAVQHAPFVHQYF